MKGQLAFHHREQRVVGHKDSLTPQINKWAQLPVQVVRSNVKFWNQVVQNDGNDDIVNERCDNVHASLVGKILDTVGDRPISIPIRRAIGMKPGLTGFAETHMTLTAPHDRHLGPIACLALLSTFFVCNWAFYSLKVGMDTW
eukprot:CAMPEP_0185791382 /NCGR_PEP_ID=MMETSP1174-20130828/158345_1 /TAXON_ID=35687 /ORGANISM="Dictyocha speculum, Strain CCMP1381" /LENGTH=141 /DNA_ID=CAMNT_0028486327 /DNA_START=985 /DNA_END=1407 /DNA_ORIENTATION=+